MFWNEAGRPRGARSVRPRARLVEQAELWDVRPVAAAPAAPAQPVEAAAPARSGVGVRARPAVRPAARTVVASSTYAERGRRVHTEDIARYLQVNNAVYGRLVPVRDLALPRRSFNAELQLWRGSEIGTPFVTGC